MPNLIEFSLTFIQEKSKGAFIKKFLRKVLTMKYIKRIYIDIEKESKDYYKIKELKKIFPDINFNIFYEIKIFKPKGLLPNLPGLSNLQNISDTCTPS